MQDDGVIKISRGMESQILTKSEIVLKKTIIINKNLKLKDT